MSNNKDEEALEVMDIDNEAPPQEETHVDARQNKKRPAAAAAAVAASVVQFSNDNKDGRQQLPWVEKYRPERLEDLVAQDDIVSILTNLIDSENLPHLLLYGRMYTSSIKCVVV